MSVNNKKIEDINLDDFGWVVPMIIVRDVLPPKEWKEFQEYMIGQTVMALESQAGYYITDIARFLKYRKNGLTAKRMPLDD